MTNLEKIKAEISSILIEYKQRFPTNSAIEPKIKPNKVIISTSDILRTPSEIKSDL